MSIKKNTNSLANLPQNKQSKVNQFINKWENEFVERIKNETNSQKQLFGLEDAIDRSIKSRKPLDKVMIEYHHFVGSNVLMSYDFYKYLLSYKKGKKLLDRYFKYDLEDLHKYYKRIDKDPDYFPFSEQQWRTYVLYMLLKFNGLYNAEEMDDMFNVSFKDDREYNPLTSIIKPLRSLLPKSLKLVQYDISRAYPTFIDIELDIDREIDVYEIIDKKHFNTLLNVHSGIEGADINKVRKSLEPVYGSKVDQVITKERFNEKGKVFRDFAKYEQQYIKKFINKNQIKNYVRLHDAVLVLQNTEVKQIQFGKVKFNISTIELPKILNNKKLFYKFDVKGKVVTSPVMYKEFFQQENIIRVTERENDKIIVFKDTNNVIIPFNHKTNMASYLARNINEYYTGDVENKVAKDASKVINEGLLLIPPKELVYYRDPKDGFGLPFKNGFFQFNGDRSVIENIPYRKVKGFFPEHDIQKFEFKPKLNSINQFSDFERFITMVSVAKDPINTELTDGDKLTVQQFKRMFGYLCHSYKNPSSIYAIILSDEGADGENRNGGRGKTIFGKAISYVQRQLLKGGSEFEGGYRHNFGELDCSYASFFIDDVPASFKYDSLYTNIVSDTFTNPKGKPGKAISFKFAPKFIISTNWNVIFDENAYSTNRRFKEFKFTTYFNKERTPKDVFGYNLFEDWNMEQWNDFYNFVFQCVRLFIEKGIEAPIYDKTIDNYNALFNNELVEAEFKRIFDDIKDRPEGFIANDFLSRYKQSDNPLKLEGYFHKNNIKKMVYAYAYMHKIDLKYRKRDRRWILNANCNNDKNDIDYDLIDLSDIN
jgi:hypothetical protein